MLGIHRQQLCVLGEEPRPLRVAGDQLAVGAPAGDVDGQQRVLVRLAGEGGACQQLRTLVLDAMSVDLQVLAAAGAHREYVAGSAHGARGAVHYAAQQRVQIGRGDQVAGGRVGALQPFGGRHELGLQRGDALLRIGGFGRQRSVPGDGVEAVRVPARLAFGLLHLRERQPEEHGARRQQAGRQFTMDGQALEARARERPDDGLPGAGLQRLHPRDGAELRRRLGDGLQDGLGRAERAQKRGDLRPGVLAQHVLAHPAGEARIAGHLDPCFKQGRHFRQRDPVLGAFQVCRLMAGAGPPQHGADGRVAAGAAQQAQQHGDHRAGDLPLAVGHRRGHGRSRHRSVLSHARTFGCEDRFVELCAPALHDKTSPGEPGRCAGCGGSHLRPRVHRGA